MQRIANYGNVSSYKVSCSYMKALERVGDEAGALGLERQPQGQEADAPHLVRRPPPAAFLDTKYFYKQTYKKNYK